MVRVLVADDSPTARAMIAEVLAEDPDIEVVAEATNGMEAIELTEELRPNVVTMDIQMPELDGFAATKEIMIRVPTPIVVVTGNYDVGDAAFGRSTFHAGALSAFPKLPGLDSPDFDEVAEEFQRTVKETSTARVYRHWRYAPLQQGTGIVRAGVEPVRIVTVATSTTGTRHLVDLLNQLPEDFAVPVLVIAHVGHGFTDGVATWLDRNVHHSVKVAEHGEYPRPGCVYVAPDNRHLAVRGEASAPSLVLCDDPPIRGFRPSSSVLCEAVAKTFGESAVVLFLRGVGDDAVLGLCSVRLAGGRVLAMQDAPGPGRRTAADDIANGIADAVLPIETIAAQLAEVCTVAGDEATEDDIAIEQPAGGGLRLAL